MAQGRGIVASGRVKGAEVRGSRMGMAKLTDHKAGFWSSILVCMSGIIGGEFQFVSRNLPSLCPTPNN